MDLPQDLPLVDAFRLHFNRFREAVSDIVQTPTDSVVIARLGDDLDEYAGLVRQNSAIFDAPELEIIQTSLAAMQSDIQLEYRDAIEASHNGRPEIVQQVQTGCPGRLRIQIDSDFLNWAYSQRSTSSIHRFLGVSRNTVRTALLEHGIATLQANPFLNHNAPAAPPADLPRGDAAIDDLLDLEVSIPNTLPQEVQNLAVSYTGPLSNISDDELDSLIVQLRSHFRRAGLRMLDEHLWVDVTAQVAAVWSDRFTILEIHHGLDINNHAHIWLLHFLFLATINSQLAFFAEDWNQHHIQIRHGPNRSPVDMFVFDMLVNSIRGNQLPAEEALSEEELEVHGIDWEGLRDDNLLASQRQNNTVSKGATSWIGRVGPPPLAEGSGQDDDCVAVWLSALAIARNLHPDIF
ncbi:hypothetical protein FB45DRAFT_866070 [Roridomyces roridus]|uniref:Integrase core domain-containing protein n=1 Tax=Roridomyces roridus TaxID=1738132 RepID=A0AAD7BVY3_9AGAR|nr:hypothetical protein FB45DRAFT_866070 [Roridomyces roridus]